MNVRSFFCWPTTQVRDFYDAPGDDLPLGARIVAVCDAVDAMVGDRPYREPMSPKQAVEELKRCAGSQFDHAVVDAFERVIAAVPTPV